MLISIITPTIGSPYLNDLLSSINHQDGLNDFFKIEHLICIDDSPLNRSKVDQFLNEVPCVNGIQRYIFDMPFSTGKNNYNGHKIYASISQLVNGEFTMFMDDDNRMDSSLILTYLKKIGHHDWMYCLRKIINENNEIICNDECESLGHLSPTFYGGGDSHLIDTNCYFVRSVILKSIAAVWNRPANYNANDPDRLFGSILMSNFKNYTCVKEHLISYRITPSSKIPMDLFIMGNQMGFKEMLYKPILYIIHFNKEKTDQLLRHVYFDAHKDVSFQDWGLNIMDTLKDHFHLRSAYTNKYIPSGSVLWTHMFDPSQLPNVLERKDLIKILYTIESPNVRHQEMWKKEFVFKYFTHVVTYWDDFLKHPNTFYHPFIHRLNFQSSCQEQDNICVNEDDGNSACILLENRSFHQSYQINESILQAMDYKRKIYVQKISKYMPIYTYGESWKDEFKGQKNIKNRITPSRFLNVDKSIDYYKKHKFTLVIENTNAKGYVSEKIYDAWMANSIPIYDGNMNETLYDYFGGIPVRDMFVSINDLDILLDDERIQIIKKNIDTYRIEVLRKVDISTYNEMIKNVCTLVQYKNYSQGNEDLYLEKYFKHIERGKGIYLELGAMDGIRFSNTKYYEDKHGWSGILIEPHPTNFSKLRLNRPNNHLLNDLISNSLKEEIDYIYSECEINSAVSGVKSTIPHTHYKTYFDKYGSIIVKLKPRRLDDLIEDTGITRIDFFVLDVEGHEREVLETFNFTKVEVYLFMIEDLNDEKICRDLMEKNGYYFVERYGWNDIYMRC